MNAHAKGKAASAVPKSTPNSKWQIKSNIARLNVPVLPESGYRIFYSWVSELPDEDHNVKMNISKVSKVLKSVPTLNNLHDYDSDDKAYLYANNVSFTKKLVGSFGTVQNEHVDVWVPDGVTSFDFYFDANDMLGVNTSDHPGRPMTTRLLSVSGCFPECSTS